MSNNNRKYKPQRPTAKHKVEDRNSERVRNLKKVFTPRRKIWSLLDIGCGNAEITQEIAETYKIKYVYGADVYEETKFKQPSDVSSIVYKQVVDSVIDLPDNTVDVITCYMAIHHFDDFAKMMSEMTRVLKPKGYLFFREHDVGNNNDELKKYLDGMHEKYEDHPGGPIYYWDRQDLKTELTTKYGFKHLADVDYPNHINNRQAIYHSLYFHK
jgi:SAM-dependent methyltransferase